MSNVCAPKRSLTFDFWGAVTEVGVPTLYDLDHLTYYFGDYLTGPAVDAAVSVTLETDNATPYMTASPDSRRVAVISRYDDETEVLAGEQTVTGQTPLPPFGLKPLSLRFTTVHAASAAHPSIPDAAVLIHGPSTVGKSSIALELMTRGWQFLSDDTSPVDREGRVHLFTRPVGIRERTAQRIGITGGTFANARRHLTTLGTTMSVHPRDLGWKIASPSKVRWAVTLSHSAEFAVTHVSGTNLDLALNVEMDQHRAVETIEMFCVGGRTVA